MSHRRVTAILDGPGMRRVQAHLLRAFDLDERGARDVLDRLVRRVMNDIGAKYARDMGAHIDAVIDLRTRLSDAVDAAIRGEHLQDDVEALLKQLGHHLGELKPLGDYLRDHPPDLDAAALRRDAAAAAARPDAPAPRPGAAVPRSHPRVEAMREEIHDVAAGLDADAIEARLTRAERLFDDGRHDEANRLLDDLSHGLDIAESAPRRRADDGGPDDADAQAAELGLPITVRPGDWPAAARARLNAVRARLTAWRDRIAGLADFVALRDRLDRDLRDLRARLRRGEHVSEAELAALEGLTDSVDAAVRDVSRRVDPDWVDAAETRLTRRLDEVRAQDPSPERTRLETDIAGLIAAHLRLRERMDPTRPGHDPAFRPGPDFARLRRTENALGRRDGEVHVDLSDPGVRAAVQAWFIARAQPLLAAGPVGEFLYARLMASLHDRSELTLAQSPRSSGERVMQTPALQREFLAHLHELPTAYQVAFLDAARGQPDGWPRTSDGRAWEVDHVDELWTGGADAAPNLLALPPGLHRQHDGRGEAPGVDLSKTGLLASFRAEFRDALKRPDEGVDARESDLGGLFAQEAP